MRGVLCACVVVAGVTHARADGEPKGAEPRLLTPTTPTKSPELGYSHKGQFLISARISTGLRAIVPYDDNVYCGETDTSTASMNAPACTGRSPFALDFELGFGVAKKIDAFLELRIGLEGDFAATAASKDGPHPFHLSPGARFFFSEAGKSRLFTTAQVVLDFTGYKDVAGGSLGTDFGLRNMNGLWIDLDRAYGFYAYVGETMSFSRWLQFELEAGIGIQARYR